MSKSLNNYFDKVILYLCKMSTHHYELLSMMNYRQLAAGCVYVGLKTIEQNDKKFVPEDHLKDICRVT